MIVAQESDELHYRKYQKMAQRVAGMKGEHPVTQMEIDRYSEIMKHYNKEWDGADYVPPER